MADRKKKAEIKKPVKIGSWLEDFCDREQESNQNIQDSLDSMRYDDRLKDSIRWHDRSYE